MSWFVLIFSGMLEAVWAVSLSKSDGFKKYLPTLVFFISLVMSMVGLAWAMRSISTGTAYAVWVGIGATLTVGWGMASGQDKPTLARIMLLSLLVGSIIGLKVVS